MTAQAVALAAVAVLLVLLIWHLTHQPKRAAIGSPAPTFVLQQLGSDGVIDLSALRGKPVVINFWASWCPPCKREAPALEKLWRVYRKQGVEFVGIDVNDADSDAERFMRAHGITYPVGRDPNSSIAADSYNVANMPVTFFVDRGGKLVGSQILGPVSEKDHAAEFRRGIQAALDS
jgi:cytochrome c biogenesis protein CcmG, thiol:disulfide interchange protein DsbE